MYDKIEYTQVESCIIANYYNHIWPAENIISFVDINKVWGKLSLPSVSELTVTASCTNRNKCQ